MIEPVKGRLTALFMLIQALLAFGAALTGLLYPSLYQSAIKSGVFKETLLTGTLAQDIIVVPAAIILALMSVRFLKCRHYYSFVIMLGLSAYFFYAYGLSVIAGNYTVLYPFNLIIFALSLYSLILGLSAFNPKAVCQTYLPAGLRKTIAGFLLITMVLFIPLWLSTLIPGTFPHIRPEAYAIFVLDLVVVIPALGLTAFMLWKHIPFGNILAGIGLFKSLTVLLSLAVGTAVAPILGLPFNYSMLGVYCLLVLFALVLGTFYMLNLLRRY